MGKNIFFYCLACIIVARQSTSIRASNVCLINDPLFCQMLMLQPGGVLSKVLCLSQVVSADELRDDEEYEDIMDDMRQEGGKFGEHISVL